MLDPYPVILIAPSDIWVTEIGFWIGVLVVVEEAVRLIVVEGAAVGGTDVNVTSDCVSDGSLDVAAGAVSLSTCFDVSPPIA